MDNEFLVMIAERTTVVDSESDLSARAIRGWFESPPASAVQGSGVVGELMKRDRPGFGGRSVCFAFLDDLHVICRPDRVQAVHQTMVRELWDHARISLYNRKAKVWNRGGIAPSGSNLKQMASKEDPDVVVWRGEHPWTTMISSQSSSAAAGKSTMFCCSAFLQSLNFQAAWLLLIFCVAGRASFTLRTVRPALVEEFAASHNHAIWTCLVKILGIDGSAVSEADRAACAIIGAYKGTQPPPRPERSRRPALGSGGGRCRALQRGPSGSAHHFGFGTPVETEERTYPELAGEGGRARLLLLKKVGFPETQVAHAWNRRWRKLLACTVVKSYPNTLLEHVANRCRWHNTLRG